MNFWGADTDQLREHGTAVSSGARRIEELIVTLSSTVESVQWIGPDADEFRSSFQVMCGERVDPATSRLFSLAKECEQHSEEQDSASEDGGSGGNQGNEGDRGDGGQSDPLNPLEAIRKALEDYDPLESDGFWGDLLGGPEAGYWGNLIWNAASIGGDIAGIFVEPTGAAAAISLVMDIPGAAIGYYDALQSFQDGDYYGTLDGLVTGGINTLDAGMAALSMVPPVPPVGLALKGIGEVGGIVTGSLDMGWSAMTMAAQADAIAGGPGGGSTSKFLMTAPYFVFEQATGIPAYTEFAKPVTDGINDLYSDVTSSIRDAVPIIDPMIDLSQRPLEAISETPLVAPIEDGATAVNEWIRGLGR